MTKKNYIETISEMLIGTKHEKYARSLYLNVAATAFIIGCSDDKVREIMQGYPRLRAGKSWLYLKDDVYQATKERSVMTA